MPLIIEQDSEELRKKPLQLSKQTKDELTVANALVSNLKNVNGKTKGFKRIKGIVQDAFGKSENEKLNDVGIHINGEQDGEIKPITFNKAKKIIHDAQKMTPFEKQMLSGTVRDLETSIKRERNSNKVTKQFKPELPKIEKPKTAKDQSIKPLKLPNGNELRLVSEMFSPNDDMWTMERQKMDDNHPYWRKVLEWTDDDEYGINYVLECFVNNENPFLPLINPMQYQRVLDLYTQGKDIPPILEKKLYQWIGIIMKNTHLVEVMNELCGKERYYPTEDVLSFFGIWDDESKKEFEEENNVDFSNMDDDNICDYILKDFCKQKYGESFFYWEHCICTDFGMKPIYNILSYYNDNSSVEDCILIVNKALDWWHRNGDLSVAFIPGGQKTLSTISNHHFMGENKKKKKSIILPENKLIKLLEYRNQLNIPFEEFGSEKNGYKLCYEHYIDFLESIGQYGELPPTNYTMEDIEKIVYDNLDNVSFYDMTYGGDEQVYFEEALEWLNKGYYKYFYNYEELIKMDENDLWNLWNENKLINEKGILEIKEKNLKAYGFPYSMKLNNKGLIYVERTISLPNLLRQKDIYYNMKSWYNGVGECWSWCIGGAESFASCNLDNNKATSIIILKGWVSPDDINWKTTTLCNCSVLNEEMEIRMSYGAKIQIDEIIGYYKKSKDDKEDDFNINGKKIPLEKPIIISA